jgi:hypothetical protein
MGADVDHHRDFVDLAQGSAWTRVDPDDSSPAGADGDATAIAIDLGQRFPVHSLQIGTSGDAGAADIRVAFSDDGTTWSPPERVPPADDAAPAAEIRIAPGEAAWARHIRVSTPSPAAQGDPAVQIWCERAAFDLIVLRKLLDADFDIVSEQPGSDVYRAYRLRSNPEQTGLSLVGVDLYENGAFGNFIIQCLIAIGICRALRLKYLKLSIMDRSEVLDFVQAREIGGITFLPANDPLPPDGYFLSGMFFDVRVQKLAGDLDQKETRRIIKDYIRPLFNRIPTHFEEKPAEELHIHIRSGDIFSTWVAPHYPQPPLAFYKLVIQRLLAEKRITSIKMVFENRLNPVIPALEAYIAEIGVPLTTQSGTLADDVAALVNARYLVFGLGTFGPGVCHLSDHVEQVFYFASGWPQHFRGISTIGKITEVVDVAGAYTKVGEWDNSPERRALMLDYPAENLAFDDA